MFVAWHPTRWWDWCLPEDKKKGIEPSFTKSWEVLKVNGKGENAFNSRR